MIEITLEIVRITFGAYILFWGLNGWFGWLPIPRNAIRFESFMTALAETGYLLEIVKVIEVLSGVLLLVGWQVPLALLALAPVVFVICSAHLWLNFAKGWRVAIIVGVPYLILFAQFLPVFTKILQ
ncbi:MAG: hypothetical protein C5B49_01460 [Bdellovibrio sp.]|nr:MAG: hypothetical protein C5B49_01460 [Bdellovibrio sp.]